MVVGVDERGNVGVVEKEEGMDVVLFGKWGKMK